MIANDLFVVCVSLLICNESLEKIFYLLYFDEINHHFTFLNPWKKSFIYCLLMKSVIFLPSSKIFLKHTYLAYIDELFRKQKYYESHINAF